VVLAVVGIAYPFVMTWIILWVTDRTVGLRVSPGDEEAGLDLSELAEVGYQLEPADMTSGGAVAAPGPPHATDAQ
jgi:ammonium transporter, Amt family